MPSIRGATNNGHLPATASRKLNAQDVQWAVGISSLIVAGPVLVAGHFIAAPESGPGFLCQMFLLPGTLFLNVLRLILPNGSLHGGDGYDWLSVAFSFVFYTVPLSGLFLLTRTNRRQNEG